MIQTNRRYAAAREPCIVCEDLVLGYGSDIVLQNVNLQLPHGIFLPFVGANGSGKTTLLRAILGLVRPLSGRITTPFRAQPPGYVSQQKTIDPLYPVSVLDIAMLGAYPTLGWRGRHERGARLAEAMRRLCAFGLGDHIHKTFDQLSGGMRQKALIARALVGNPTALIMDEPTTELDHASRREVLDILRRAAADEGRTVLMVHHGIDLIAGMASQVCLVHEGRARLVPVEEASF